MRQLPHKCAECKTWFDYPPYWSAFDACCSRKCKKKHDDEYLARQQQRVEDAEDYGEEIEEEANMKWRI